MSSKRLAASQLGPVVIVFLLLLATLGPAGCGTSSHLDSISVSPPTADAAASGGQVQFTATGIFSDGHQVKPFAVRWTIGPPFVLAPVPAGVSIDSNGLAQCTGLVGTVAIFATAPVDNHIALSQMNANMATVSGSAQLTCP